jgi:hypothetical protein
LKAPTVEEIQKYHKKVGLRCDWIKEVRTKASDVSNYILVFLHTLSINGILLLLDIQSKSLLGLNRGRVPVYLSTK